MRKRFIKAVKNSSFLYSLLKNVRTILMRFLRPRGVYLLFNCNKPLSSCYGLDRGGAIDRHYIEKFLLENETLIKGSCLEVLDNEYTTKFGSARVNKSDILDIDKGNDSATIYGDLRNLTNVKNEQYDCIILTQVLQFIDDIHSAIGECHRILKPGGALLVTLPSVSRIDCVSGVDGDYWRFTQASARYLFGKQFAKENISIRSYGNVAINASFLAGFALEEVDKNNLEYNDDNFPLLICAKVVK